MKKNIFLRTAIIISLLISGASFLNAQVTVGANTAPNATLDVVASAGTPAGVIAPRLTLIELKAADPQYLTPQNGAIVYVTDATGGTTPKTANVTSTGYYYYDAVPAVWKSFGAPAPVYTVSPVLTQAEVPTYVIKPTDIYIALNVTAACTLQLPTVDVPVGRVIYMSNTGNRTVSVLPPYRNLGFSGVAAGVSGAVIHIGGGQWDWITGLAN